MHATLLSNKLKFREQRSLFRAVQILLSKCFPTYGGLPRGNITRRLTTPPHIHEPHDGGLQFPRHLGK